MIRLFLLTVLWLSAAQALWAQDAAHLIADRIEILPNGTLRASGSVTVWHGEVQITARDITYASGEGQLSLTGPIKLQDGNGTVILADQADLSPDLSAGIITSARIILSRQVQIAAAQIASGSINLRAKLKRIADNATTSPQSMTRCAIKGCCLNGN